jgi:hypothetical protein
MNEDQPVNPTKQVIELADMTDEQKRIVAAGQSIAGSFPKNLTKNQLVVWMRDNLFKL